jgi:hypothetical protein
MKSKVFISWSGEVSQAVASLLRTWIPDVVHFVDLFMSEEDIAKGQKGFDVIASNLRDATTGIVCLTPDNLTAPWILFEAGALSNSLGARERMCPFLFGLRKADVKPPLSQFQLTSPDKADVRRLVSTLNSSIIEEYRASTSELDRRFERMWPELESGLNELEGILPVATASIRRPATEILSEILDIVRHLQRRSTASISFPPISMLDDELEDQYAAVIDASQSKDYPIVPGSRVQHPIFGEGKVLSLEGAGNQKKAMIFFKEVGHKKLVLRYANLKII